MIRNGSNMLAGACLLAALASGGPVGAEDWKVTGEFGRFGVGRAYELEKGHFYWVGAFSGTFFNDSDRGACFTAPA